MRFKLFSLFLFTILLVTPGAGFSAQTRIGVLDFYIEGPEKFSHLNRALAKLLAFRFRQNRALKFFSNRGYRSRIFSNRTGYLSYSRLQKIFRKTKIKYLLKGGVSIKKNRITLTIKLFSRTGSVLYQYQKSTSHLSDIFNLFDDAHQQISGKIGFGYRTYSPASIKTDILFCIDSSGSMHNALPDLENSMARFFSQLDNCSPHINSRYGAIFFRGKKITGQVQLTSSRSAILKSCEAISAHGDGKGNLAKIIDYAINYFPWHKQRTRVLVLYTNSATGAFLNYQIARLRQMNIAVIAIAAEGSSTRTVHSLYELASNSRGSFQRADYLCDYSYRIAKRSLIRSFLLKDGRLYRFSHPVNHFAWHRYGPHSPLYSKQGRVFHSFSIEDAERILKNIKRRTIQVRRISASLEKNIFYGLQKLLRLRGVRLYLSTLKGSVLLKTDKTQLRLLLSNLTLLRTLQRYQRRRKMVWLGAAVLAANYTPQGATLNPQTLLLPVQQNRIPDLVKIPLWRILAKHHFYATHGLFTPNRWFFKAKIISVRLFDKVRFELEP